MEALLKNNSNEPLRYHRKVTQDQEFKTPLAAGLRKYNLSSKYQNVKSSYMDTGSAVEKLRKEA